MEIDALLPLGHQHPYKAVRVRSGSNALTLKTLPGYAEVKKLKNDCSGCLGKYFVAKGGTPPTGVAAGQHRQGRGSPVGGPGDQAATTASPTTRSIPTA